MSRPQAASPDLEYANLLKEIAVLEKQTSPDAAQKLKDAQRRVAELLAMRRRSDRFQVVIPADVHCGGKTGPASITNIGGGGLYVKTSLELAKGERVDVEVKSGSALLPAGVVFKATVAWSKAGQGAGVAFAAMDARTSELLKRLLAALVKDQPPARPA